MYYKPLTHRWEGNEKDLILFDVFESDDSFDSTISLPPYIFETEKRATLHLGLIVPEPTANVFESAIAEFKKIIRPEDVKAFQTATLKEVWKTVEALPSSVAVQTVSFVHSAIKSLENFSKAVEAACNGTSYMAWIWVNDTQCK
jgi:hypothetical protein